MDTIYQNACDGDTIRAWGTTSVLRFDPSPCPSPFPFYADKIIQKSDIEDMPALCGNDTIIFIWAKEPLEKPLVQLAGNLLTITNPVQGLVNYFYKDGVLLDTSSFNFMFVGGPGSYQVGVLDTLCGMTWSDPLVITSTASLDQNLGIKIYPNPAQEYLTIETNTDSPLDIELLDLYGRVVGKWRQEGGKTTIELHALKKGTYILRSIGDEHSWVEPLAIE